MVLAMTFYFCLVVVVSVHTGKQLPTELGNLVQGLCGIHSLEGAGKLR